MKWFCFGLCSFDREVVQPPNVAFVILRVSHGACQACGRGGSWERALSLVDDMRQAGLSPDELIYR